MKILKLKPIYFFKLVMASDFDLIMLSTIIFFLSTNINDRTVSV